MRSLLVALVAVPALASAETKLTLQQVIDKAVAGPRVRMAIHDREAAGVGRAGGRVS